MKTLFGDDVQRPGSAKPRRGGWSWGPVEGVKLRVLSLGLGVQSTTLALMAMHGEIDGPLPDCAIVADMMDDEPGWTRETLDFLQSDNIQLPFPIHLVKNEGGLGASFRERAKTGGTRFASAPFYTANGGQARRQCTRDFKIMPIARKERDLMGYKPRQRIPPRSCEIWIGISTDEVVRAGAAFERWAIHRYPLLEKRMSRHDCERWLERNGYPRVKKSACVFCLAGETEVVTREGIRPIRELAGGEHYLLVPSRGKLGGLASTGGFRRVPVRSFGMQPLLAVHLRRGRQEKTVYATENHQWIMAPGSQWAHAESYRRRTIDLRPGDVLKSLRSVPLARERPSPFGVAQGFVFGDGAIHSGNRPVTLNIYDNGKDAELLPYFSLCGVSEYESVQGRIRRIYDLPRTWKKLPTLDESRSFLLGWLSGYFAADGSVSDGAQSVLESADPLNLEFVRSVCAILGISCSPVRSRIRNGFNGAEPLYRVTIRARQLPDSFWIIPDHARRVTGEPAQPFDWAVVEVSQTDRVEEVFCATVPEVEAFGLSDDLMTGNCPYRSNAGWRDLRDNDPAAFAQACEIDRLIRATPGMKHANFVHRSRVPLAEADLSGSDPAQGMLEICEGGCGL